MQLLKTRKPRTFKFEPRYYNERKEALDARVERIKAEMGLAEHTPGSTIRGSFQQARTRKKPINIFGAQVSPTINKVLRVVSIVLIGFIMYFVYQSVVSMMQQYQVQQAKKAEQGQQQQLIIEE